MARRHPRPHLLLLFRLVRGARGGGELLERALSIKTLIMPEWWLLAPMPLAFALLSIEFLFRMHRLAQGEQRPRGRRGVRGMSAE